MKRKTKRGRAAFTLTEFLAVIAIITILASLSFVAVIRYQRQLRRLEMDQTAKEIFLAAQNHLTLEISGGTIPRLLNLDEHGQLSEEEQTSKLGIKVDKTALTTADGEDGDADTDAGDLYAILYTPSEKKNSDGKADSGEENPEEPADGGTASGNQTEEIRERLLPFGSIDETVRVDGSYLIFYAPKAGIVREVWYSDRYEFVPDDIESQALSEAAADAKKRERFTGANSTYQDKKLAIGHYASGTLENPDVGPVETFQAPTVKLINDDILYAEIQDPNETEHSLRLFVKGETSGTLGYIEVNQAGTGRSARVSKTVGSSTGQSGTYQVILDDVSAPENAETASGGFKFSDFNLADQTDMTLQKDERGFASFIPGENIYVYAQVFNNQKLSSIETSGMRSDNSLFAAIGDDRSAVIGSFRHLENLDERVSGWEPDKVYEQPSSESNPDTVTAMQSRNLAWKAGDDAADESAYCIHVAKLHETFGTTQLNKNAQTISIAYRKKEDASNPDQTNPTYQKLHTAAGSYLPLEPQYVLNYQGNTKRIDGLQVGKTDGSEIRAAEGTGGLFGSVTRNLTIQNLWLRQPVIHTQGSAGALVGEIATGTRSNRGVSFASVQLANIQVEYPQIRAEQENAAAGALIGAFDGNSLTIKKALAENHFRSKLGSAQQDLDDLTAEKEAAYRICAAKGIAGGLIGCARGEVSLTDCASALYVEGKTAGGLVGTAEKRAAGTSGQAGNSVQIQRCYVGGHTAEGEFQLSEKPGEAAGANDKFENQPGRYNIAAYTGGIAGGLAAKLPADSQVSYSYVTASVYTGAGDDFLTSSAFIASYEEGTAGKLPSDLLGEGDSALPCYPGSYSSSLVNETEVIAYAPTLSEEFAKEKAENPPKNAYPYDAQLKAAPNNPMPTVQAAMEAEAETDPSKAEAAKKLPWFLKNHVGDWVKVEEKKNFTITNGNRLYVDYVSQKTLKENQQLYLTFSVTGEISQKTVWYVVSVKTGNLSMTSLENDAQYFFTDKEANVYSRVNPTEYPPNQSESLFWKNFTETTATTARFEIGKTPSNQLKLRFYLDDLSRVGGSYCRLWTWGNYEGGFVNGENIVVRLSEDGYPPKATSPFSVEGNSCFADKIEKNTDGEDTYTVKIANSRHLLNLNFCGDGYGGLKITRAIQTDNILWQEDNSVPAETEAYCKEIQEAYGNVTIYSPGNSSYSDGNFWPIENSNLLSYEGKSQEEGVEEIYTIAKLKLRQGVGNTALFKKTNHLTISNLNLKDPDVNIEGHTAATLVAQAGEDNIPADTFLTLENIRVYGDTLNIIGNNTTGGVVGIAKVADLTMKNVKVEGKNIQVTGGQAGAVIGAATAGVITMERIRVIADSFTVTGANWNPAGGIAGELQSTHLDRTGSSDEIHIKMADVHADTMRIEGDKYAGGIAGQIMGGTVQLQDMYVYGKNAQIHGKDGSGGLSADVEAGKQMTLDNSFFSGYTKSDFNNTGGLLGNLTIQNGGPSFQGPESSITKCYVGGRNRSIDYTQGNQESILTRKTLVAPGAVGGLIGKAAGALRVEKCFSAADVYGNKVNGSPMVGGLLGAYDKANSPGMTISSSYLAGSVKAEGGKYCSGYFIGLLNNQWDDNASIEGFEVEDTCHYVLFTNSDANIDQIIGKPMRNMNSPEYKDKNLIVSSAGSGTSLLGGKEEDGNNCMETIRYNTRLKGNYPLRIWTTYDTETVGTGKRLYVGDWEK